MLDRLLQHDLLLVEAQDLLVEVEDQLELVAVLLDSKDGPVALSLHIERAHVLLPLLEVLGLGLLEAHRQRVASLLEVETLLLRFPVLTQNLLDAVLIELQLLVQLVDPHDLVDDAGEVASLVQSAVHAVLVQQLALESLDVLMDLRYQLELVLGDCTPDAGTHKQLVVDGEDLKHLVCCACLLQLLFEFLRQLRLDFACARLVGFFGRIPLRLAVARVV